MADITLTENEQLLIDVKSYLHITWQDEITDKNITGFINRGKTRLQQIAGVSLDFISEDSPRSLLFDYCRYANSQALEMFEKNFASELLDLNLDNQFATPEKLIVISTAGATENYTNIKVSPSLSVGNSYLYILGENLDLPKYFQVCDTITGYTVWNGTDEILVVAGNEVMIIEVDENMKAIKAGKVDVIVR